MRWDTPIHVVLLTQHGFFDQLRARIRWFPTVAELQRCEGREASLAEALLVAVRERADLAWWHQAPYELPPKVTQQAPYTPPSPAAVDSDGRPEYVVSGFRTRNIWNYPELKLEPRLSSASRTSPPTIIEPIRECPLAAPMAQMTVTLNGVRPFMRTSVAPWSACRSVYGEPVLVEPPTMTNGGR